jgi:glycosyltransferase involved in cell wall biosynthesis
LKISIITVSFNSVATIRHTIESFLQQDYPNKEYIIIDGASTDGTVEILKSYQDKIRFISEPDKGIYDAMNKGVKLATGDLVGVIGSDDFYPNEYVLSKVALAFKENKADAIYGDLQYVQADNIEKITRNWKSGNYKREKFLFGWMPPHTAFFLTKKAYNAFGGYKDYFRSAGDYELMLRMLFKNQLKAHYLPEILMKMRVGGTSNMSIKNRWRANQEDQKAWIINGLKPHWFTRWLKPLSKISQWF